MDYSVITLAALGVFGVLIHNLVKLNELNRKLEGNINLWSYLKLERFAILLSLCVVAVALIVRSEVKQLEQVGNWLGIAFVAIGYMAQSIIVTIMGRGQKFLDNSDKN
jgi:hypothetical protein